LYSKVKKNVAAITDIHFINNCICARDKKLEFLSTIFQILNYSFWQNKTITTFPSKLFLAHSLAGYFLWKSPVFLTLKLDVGIRKNPTKKENRVRITL